MKAFTNEASVMAAMRWLTPVPSISALILAVTSSGVPEIDSFSASSGLVSSMPLARSPAPMASMMGVSDSGSTPLRLSCSWGIEEA